MKTISINLYSFDELSKEIQGEVISNFQSSATECNWWQSVYDDAEEIGLKLEDFGMDSASFVRNLQGNFTLSAHEVAANIVRDHGADCETLKTAQTFLDAVNTTQLKYDEHEGEEYENEMMEIEDKFLNGLLSDYTDMLQEQLKYEESEEAAKETIKANDYFFFQDGELAHCITYCGKHEKAGITEFNFHGQTISL